MTNPTPHGQVPAIQRYSIGYHSDEWGVRSSTLGGIPDPSGQWVRYEDHAAEFQRLHAYCQEIESQVILDCMTHVQNPAENEHVAGNVLKNGAEVNMNVYAELPEPDATTVGLGAVWNRHSMRDFADATHALRTQQPAPATQQAGWKCAPVEPTDAMVQAAHHIDLSYMPGQEGADRAAIYRAMLAAAPQPSHTTQAAESVTAAATESYVQPVPDKCDRIVWRGHYYHLPPAQAAESVLEDAARLDFLIEQRAYVVSDPDTCPGYWLHFVHKETGKCWVQADEHPTPRAAIDAAMNKGGAT